MDTARATRVLGVAVIVVLAIIALLWLWPRGTAETSVAATTPVRRAAPPPSEAAAVEDREQRVPLAPDLSDLVNPTPFCTTVVGWDRRNVPAWVIEDNMMAQAMKFDEADLACLTSAGLPPQILDFAEQNIRRPQPPVR
jgi:hypothetical protein